MVDEQDLSIEVEKFKSEIRFPNFQPSQNIQEIITVCSDKSLLTNMSHIQLQEMAIILAGYSLYLSVQENRINSYINWCEANIKGIVGRELQNSSAFSFQEKDLSIRMNNDHASKLESIKRDNEVKLGIIKNIGYKISFLSERLENLAREKRYSSRD